MSFISDLSQSAKNLVQKTKDMMPKKSLSCTLDIGYKYSLSTKMIVGKYILTAHDEAHISHISYTIKELQDPIIGKEESELEILHTSTGKKKIHLNTEDEKTIKLSLPIVFEPTTSDIGAGDLSLMNKASERSKLTAINFKLYIKVHYTLPNSKDPKKVYIYTKKHDINFE